MYLTSGLFADYNVLYSSVETRAKTWRSVTENYKSENGVDYQDKLKVSQNRFIDKNISILLSAGGQ